MKVLKVLGWVFLVVGILGFFSNPIIGASAGAWFHTDLVHNLVHLITGLIMLWVAYKATSKASVTLKTFGWIYLVLAILGWILVSGTGSLLGIVEINGADNWLHLVLGLILLWAGMKCVKGADSMDTASVPPVDESAGSVDGDQI